jgi:hypothetical protein
MTTQHVVITYDSKNNSFSASQNPLVVYPGVTQIVWTVELTEESTGVIYFGTEPTFQGIDFGPRWAGTKPKGDTESWTVAIDDQLNPGQTRRYHYTVNTWYKLNDEAKTAEKKSWDPEVEENGDPPPVA